MSDDDMNDPQPTLCSQCGGTQGRCESCIKNRDALVAIALDPAMKGKALKLAMEGQVIEIVERCARQPRA